jgi:hypothetical protein
MAEKNVGVCHDMYQTSFYNMMNLGKIKSIWHSGGQDMHSRRFGGGSKKNEEKRLVTF